MEKAERIPSLNRDGVSEPGNLGSRLRQPARKQLRIERRGRLLTWFSATVMMVILLALLFFITSKGISTFIKDGVSLSQFFPTSGPPPTGNSERFPLSPGPSR